MIRPLRFRKVKRENYRLNLMLPTIWPEQIFGGIASALRVFEAIVDELGCESRIVVTEAEPTQDSLDKFSKKYTYVSYRENSNAKHQLVSMAKRKARTLPVSEKDQFMFSAWWTAYVIQAEYGEWEESGKLKPNPFLYLVQDYEPGFYAWSSEYVLSEATYHCEYPQIAIFNSKELATYFENMGYTFAKTYCFDPLLNPVLKKKVLALDSTVYKRKQILVYGRPSVDRNMFDMVVESLRKWISIQPGAESWTFLSAGEMHDPVDLGRGLYLESVGKLSLKESAEMLSESFAGISLMVSPHPSYPPLEMATFDVKVITNSYANKDMTSFSPNITSVDRVSPTKIARELKESAAISIRLCHIRM